MDRGWGYGDKGGGIGGGGAESEVEGAESGVEGAGIEAGYGAGSLERLGRQIIFL